MRSLPTWAIYLISGLSAVVMLLSGISGTLLVNDRQSVTKQMDKFTEILEKQNEQIKEIVKHNDRQNHVTEKLCWYMSLDYKSRREMMDKYPVLPSLPKYDKP